MPKLDYPYLRAWGWHLGSSREYVADQIQLARQDGAPQDVIYAKLPPLTAGDEHTFRGSEGRVWVRFGGVTREDTKRAISERVAKLQAKTD